MKATRLNPEEIERIAAIRGGRGLLPVGVDVASRVFQACWLDPASGRISNRQFTRDRFFDFVRDGSQGRRLFGIEACGACAFMSRFMESCGHECRIMPASRIKAFLGLDKTDRIDAAGILKALISPSIPSVRPRSLDGQALMALINARLLLVKLQVQAVNAAHAAIYEMGGLAGNCSAKAPRRVLDGLGQAAASLPAGSPAASHFACLSSALSSSIGEEADLIKAIDAHLAQFGEGDSMCRLMATVPGIGLQTAVLLRAAMGEPSRFASARSFAAFIGVAPRVSGTGGRTSVLGVRRSGVPAAKRALYMCAMAYLGHAMKSGAQPPWLRQRLNAGACRKKLVCALMNRLCRIAFAVARTGKPFDKDRSNLVKPLRR